MKKYFATILLFSLALIFAPDVSALNSAVYFEGGADNFVFYPGTAWNEADLFDGFKNVMPGDTLTETVKVRNTATEYDYVKIYLRANPHNNTNPMSEKVSEKETVASMEDFLAQLSMRVQNDNDVIFNASSDKLDGLKNNVLLGEFANGDKTTLTIELNVPKTLENKYMHRSGEVDWIFTAEGYKDGEIVPADDTPNNNNSGSNTNTNGAAGKPKPLPNSVYTLDNIINFVVLLAVSMIGLLIAGRQIYRYFRKEEK